MARRGLVGQGNTKKKKGDNMDKTKLHPGWKNAFEIILKRFDQDGYGVMFSDEQLLTMLDIEKPDVGTYDDFQKFQLERLKQMESLKNALLEQCNLCMENMRGQGYVLMHPNDQVLKTANKYYRLSKKKINKMLSVLTNVDNEHLDHEGRDNRLRMLGRAAFIKSAMNKRKIINGETKKIE